MLVISKKHYKNIFDTPNEVLSRMILVARFVSIAISASLGATGINIVMTNNPDAGQTIMHSHIHVIPRYPEDGIRFGFRPKRTKKEELQKVADKLRRAVQATKSNPL